MPKDEESPEHETHSTTAEASERHDQASKTAVERSIRGSCLNARIALHYRGIVSVLGLIGTAVFAWRANNPEVWLRALQWLLMALCGVGGLGGAVGEYLKHRSRH